MAATAVVFYYYWYVRLSFPGDLCNCVRHCDRYNGKWVNESCGTYLQGTHNVFGGEYNIFISNFNDRPVCGRWRKKVTKCCENSDTGKIADYFGFVGVERWQSYWALKDK